MKKQKSKILISLSLTILLCSLPIMGHAESDSTEIPRLVKESETIIAGEQVNTETYISNGQTVIAATYNEDDTYSKDKVIAAKLGQYQAQESLTSRASTYGASNWGKNRLYLFTGVASNNKNVAVNCAINANTPGKPYGANIHVWGGHTYGTYNGTSPYNAKQMRITQEYEVTATTVSVNMSVPGGVSVSGGLMSKVATWTSAPVQNTWSLEAAHKDITANCVSIPGTMKLAMEDASEALLGNTFYRAYARLNKTWDNIYYG